MKCKTACRKKALLQSGGADMLKGLSECCHNVLAGNVPLKERHVKKLNKYKKQLRQMANRKVTIKTKGRLVTQSGGFIGPLLSVLAPIISSIASSFIR